MKRKFIKNTLDPMEVETLLFKYWKIQKIYTLPQKRSRNA